MAVIYPPLDGRFETFDHEYFEIVKKFDKDYKKRLEEGDNVVMTDLPDGTHIYIADYSKTDGFYHLYVTPPYSYFSVSKVYDERGYITKKGLSGEPFYWKKGRWYYFNSERKLEKTVNYDEVSKFTFEEVEAFCLSKGMTLRRGNESKGAFIQRIYDPGASYNCWEITYRKYAITYVRYRLDLQTGAVLSYEEFERRH